MTDNAYNMGKSVLLRKVLSTISDFGSALRGTSVFLTKALAPRGYEERREFFSRTNFGDAHKDKLSSGLDPEVIEAETTLNWTCSVEQELGCRYASRRQALMQATCDAHRLSTDLIHEYQV